MLYPGPTTGKRLRDPFFFAVFLVPRKPVLESADDGRTERREQIERNSSCFFRLTRLAIVLARQIERATQISRRSLPSHWNGNRCEGRRQRATFLDRLNEKTARVNVEKANETLRARFAPRQ